MSASCGCTATTSPSATSAWKTPQCEECGRSVDQQVLIDPTSMMTGSKPTLRETVHWYLRLDQLQTALASWLAGKNDAGACGALWRPIVLRQSLGRIESEGLPERAMTRDLTWGVPVPLDDPDAQGKSLYVWFDAPIGYVAATIEWARDHAEDQAAWRKYWITEDSNDYQAALSLSDDPAIRRNLERLLSERVP